MSQMACQEGAWGSMGMGGDTRGHAFQQKTSMTVMMHVQRQQMSVNDAPDVSS